MRLLLLTTDSYIGGTERIVLNIANKFSKEGHNISVCTLIGGGGLDNFLTKEVVYYTADLKSKFDFKKIKKLFNHIKKFNPDIIHSFLFHGNLIGRIYKMFNKNVRLITSERAMDFKRPYLKVLINRFLSRYDEMCVAVSEAVKEILIKRKETAPEKTKVLYNGFDLKKYDIERTNVLHEELNIPRNKKIIACIARLRWEKNYIKFLRNAEKLLKLRDDVAFVIAGSGPLRDEVETEIEKLGIRQNVFMLGFRNDIHQILSDVYINTLLSREEGLPGSVIEACLCGVPSVATGIGGIKEIIKDGETGMLVDLKDIDKAYLKINELLLNDELYSKISVQAKKYTREKFANERFYDDLTEIYKQKNYNVLSA